jgi:hypothetical protein
MRATDMGYRIEVRDKNLNRIGEIDTWLQLDMVIQFCDQGSWQLLVKAGTPQAELLQQGGGVAIYQEGVDKPICTGQIESFQTYWTVQQHSSVGSVFVGGKTDNKLAFQRLAFPDPTRSIATQYASAVSTRNVKAEPAKLIWKELRSSLGPGALADRRVNGFNAGPEPSFGASAKSDTLRYDVIGEKLTEWCSDKKTGWQILYNPNTRTLDLDIYKPRDLSKTIRLSPELGNLREYIWTLSAPKVTRVVVACQGEGKDRYIYQRIDSASEAEWSLKIEAFVDRRDVPLKTSKTGSPQLVTTILENGWEDIGQKPDGGEWTQELADAKAAYEAAVEAGDPDTDPEYDAVVAAIANAKPVAVAYYLDVVQQAAAEVLKEGEKKGNFQVYPIDTEQIKFGRDYFVGDIVTVDVNGTTYVDMVREVNITVDDGGNALTVSPKVGEQGSGDPLNLYATVFELRKKLRKLEARM